jgi:WS/DGAT/MGAT family acyltransferase
VLRSVANNTRQSVRLARTLTSAIPVAMSAIRDRDTESSVPLTRLNEGKPTPHRVIDGCLFDLEEVKSLRAAVPGSTLNDVVLSVIGGALRRYLEARGELPGASLVSGMPVNVRTEADAHADNMVGATMVSLCTDIDDAVARLAGVHASTTSAKQTHETIGARLMPEVTMNIPAPVGRASYRSMLSLGSRFGVVPMNTLVTNVPGIQKPLYMSGAHMLCMMGMGPVTEQMLLFHGVFSYHEGISITFTACRRAMPDPAFYRSCIQAAYVELLNTALRTGKRKGKQKGKAGKRQSRAGRTRA